jgi:hypothetical protein
VRGDDEDIMMESEREYLQEERRGLEEQQPRDSINLDSSNYGEGEGL